MNYYKGFVAPLLLALIAVLLIGGGAYTYIQKNKVNQAGDGDVTLPQATSTAQTSDWKTYTNSDYGFEVKYPSDWKVTDVSQVIPISNTRRTAVDIGSPVRYDLSGYQGIPTNYRILIYLDSSSQIQSAIGFGSSDPKFGHQSEWNIDVTKKVMEDSNEYKIGQQIISSFKLTK